MDIFRHLNFDHLDQLRGLRFWGTTYHEVLCHIAQWQAQTDATILVIDFEVSPPEKPGECPIAALVFYEP